MKNLVYRSHSKKQNRISFADMNQEQTDAIQHYAQPARPISGPRFTQQMNQPLWAILQISK